MNSRLLGQGGGRGETFRFSLLQINCFSFHFSKRPLVMINYEIRELVVFYDFIAKIYPFRPYTTTNMYLYTPIICSTCYKYLFRPSLYLCTSAIQI